jgi:cytidyltransferase-like protein
MAYNIVVCGGTFDHFHKGHRSFLKFAFSFGKKIIIGITSDEYVKNSKLNSSATLKAKIQNSEFELFEKRKGSVTNFLKQEGILNKTEIVKINDLFGSTISKDLKIDAIVVSSSTKKGADIINKKRKELNLTELKVFIAPYVKAEDGGIISSAKIRNGKINRIGRLYVNPLWLKKDLRLSENLRNELKNPWGEIIEKISNSNNAPFIIAVGDATVKKLNENFIKQNISVVDFKIARREFFSSFLELGFPKDSAAIKLDNPAGHITHNLFLKLAELFKSNLDKKIIIKIEGEDDLAVLPLILVAPLGSIVYYGQPGVGLVKILVSEEIKEKTYDLASKFRPI